MTDRVDELERRIDAAVGELRTDGAGRGVPPAAGVRRRLVRGRVVVAVAAVFAMVVIAGVASPLFRPVSHVEFEPASPGPSTADMSWSPLPSLPHVDMNYVGGAVWTGDEVLLWSEFGGARFDPATRSWRDMPKSPTGEAPLRQRDSGVWTGEELVVYGLADSEARLAAFDPETSEWRMLPPPPFSERVVSSLVWTGREIVMWGGAELAPADATGVGAAFDPAAETWRRIAEAPLSARQWHSAVWTGREVVVWGGTQLTSGGSDLDDGAAYDPVTDSWRTLADSPLSARWGHSAFWTGREMLVVGGNDGSGTAGTMASYDPALDQWRSLGSSESVAGPATAWTGSQVLVYGGAVVASGETRNTGELVDPESGRTVAVPAAPMPGACGPLSMAIPGEVLIWGGARDCVNGGDGTRQGASLRTGVVPDAAPVLDRVTALPTLPELPAEGLVVDNAGGVRFLTLEGEEITTLPGFAIHHYSEPGEPILLKRKGGPTYRLNTRQSRLVRVRLDEAMGNAQILPPLPQWRGRPPVRGHWRWALPSPEGSVLLAQWSGECEVPSAYFVELHGDAQDARPVLEGGPFGEAESIGLGWSANGRAVVEFPRPACGSGIEQPGIYLVSLEGDTELITATKGWSGDARMWSSN